MKRKVLKKMLCAAIMVSLVIPAIPASAAQGGTASNGGTGGAR